MLGKVKRDDQEGARRPRARPRSCAVWECLWERGSGQELAESGEVLKLQKVDKTEPTSVL